MELPTARKPTGEVTQQTKRRRTETLNTLRDIMSGGDAKEQFKDELKTLTQEEKNLLIREAGLTQSLSEGQGLSLKADLDLPWHRLRKLRRYVSNV